MRLCSVDGYDRKHSAGGYYSQIQYHGKILKNNV